MVFDSSIILKAKRMIVSTGTGYAIQTSFEGLGAEISNRFDSLKIIKKSLGKQNLKNFERYQALSGSFSYSSKRLTDILIRLQEISWKRSSLAYEIEPDTFAPPIDPKVFNYSNYLGLSIKDFHVDIISFMDSLAPVIIQSEMDLKSKDKKNLPGWSDIEKNTNRSYRTKLSTDLCSAIDSCDRWLPLVKKIRHVLTHRKHENIVFIPPKEGLLFQIYDHEMQASIIIPEVLYVSGKNVVDFELYSAFILSELFVLISDLGFLLADKLGLSGKSFTKMCIREISESTVTSIDRLSKFFINKGT